MSRTAGHSWLAQSAGVRPRVRKPRPPLRLSLEERETISRGVAQKKTFTAIATELLAGRYSRSHLVTLVLGHSRHLLTLPLPDTRTSTVVGALTRTLQALPPAMRGSLTWDSGIEMTLHEDLTRVTGVALFFCDAYSPWRRGSNEDTDGLLRQYFPKKTDLSRHRRTRSTVVCLPLRVLFTSRAWLRVEVTHLGRRSDTPWAVAGGR